MRRILKTQNKLFSEFKKKPVKYDYFEFFPYKYHEEK